MKDETIDTQRQTTSTKRRKTQKRDGTSARYLTVSLGALDLDPGDEIVETREPGRIVITKASSEAAA